MRNMLMKKVGMLLKGKHLFPINRIDLKLDILTKKVINFKAWVETEKQ